MVSDCDVRNLESLCKHDIRFMYIMQEETPSHMTFERLMKDYLINDIDYIFFDIVNNICHLMNVDKSVQYIDAVSYTHLKQQVQQFLLYLDYDVNNDESESLKTLIFYLVDKPDISGLSTR